MEELVDKIEVALGERAGGRRAAAAKATFKFEDTDDSEEEESELNEELLNMLLPVICEELEVKASKAVATKERKEKKYGPCIQEVRSSQSFF